MGNAGSALDEYKLIDQNKVDEIIDALEADPDGIDLLNDEGETMLFRACSNGAASIVSILLDRGADASIPCDDITCLHVAAAAHSPKCVQLLLENGADPNVTTLDSMTPLHCAIEYGDFIAAKMLIERGADINVKTSAGIGPFEMKPAGGSEMGAESMTDAQISILQATAKKIDDKKNVIDYDAEDEEELRKWFKEAGLGSKHCRQFAKSAIARGIRSGKMLAFMILTSKITLEQLGIKENIDLELVNLSCKSALPV